MKIQITESVLTFTEKELYALQAICRQFIDKGCGNFQYPYNDMETYENAKKLSEQILKHENH